MRKENGKGGKMVGVERKEDRKRRWRRHEGGWKEEGEVRRGK